MHTQAGAGQALLRPRVVMNYPNFNTVRLENCTLGRAGRFQDVAANKLPYRETKSESTKVGFDLILDRIPGRMSQNSEC